MPDARHAERVVYASAGVTKVSAKSMATTTAAMPTWSESGMGAPESLKSIPMTRAREKKTARKVMPNQNPSIRNLPRNDFTSRSKCGKRTGLPQRCHWKKTRSTPYQPARKNMLAIRTTLRTSESCPERESPHTSSITASETSGTEG